MSPVPPDPRAVARATHELRRGEPVIVTGGPAALEVLAVELATEESLAARGAGARADLLLTGPRAALLNNVNQRAAAEGPVVRVLRAPWMDLPASVAIADPVRDLATPFKGPFRTADAGEYAAAMQGAVALAKGAGLLPALFAVPARAGADRLAVEATQIAAATPASGLRLVTRARLPLDGAPDAEVIAFRPAMGGPEHLALRIGAPRTDRPVLVRLHSACLTGDLLGSLKCDCGPQLRAAIAAIAANPEGGILLYLQQEGRGIGLINKLRAYALQDQGFDTVDANLRLGFGEDERDFGLAAAMLGLLNVDSVELLTNNPGKVAGLEANGVKVVRRIAHALPANPHNAHYLATKRDRSGHLL